MTNFSKVTRGVAALAVVTVVVDNDQKLFADALQIATAVLTAANQNTIEIVPIADYDPQTIERYPGETIHVTYDKKAKIGSCDLYTMYKGTYMNGDTRTAVAVKVYDLSGRAKGIKIFNDHFDRECAVHKELAQKNDQADSLFANAIGAAKLESHGKLIIVTELVEGVPLTSEMSLDGIEDTVQTITNQLADAFVRLQQLGFVHGGLVASKLDLKSTRRCVQYCQHSKTIKIVDLGDNVRNDIKMSQDVGHVFKLVFGLMRATVVSDPKKTQEVQLARKQFFLDFKNKKNHIDRHHDQAELWAAFVNKYAQSCIKLLN